MPVGTGGGVPGMYMSATSHCVSLDEVTRSQPLWLRSLEANQPPSRNNELTFHECAHAQRDGQLDKLPLREVCSPLQRAAGLLPSPLIICQIQLKRRHCCVLPHPWVSRGHRESSASKPPPAAFLGQLSLLLGRGQGPAFWHTWRRVCSWMW